MIAFKGNNVKKSRFLFLFIIIIYISFSLSCSVHNRDNPYDPAAVSNLEDVPGPLEKVALEFTAVNGNAVTPFDNITLSMADSSKWPVVTITGRLINVNESYIEDSSCSINDTDHSSFALDTVTLIFTISSPVILFGNNSISIYVSKVGDSGTANGTIKVMD